MLHQITMKVKTDTYLFSDDGNVFENGYHLIKIMYDNDIDLSNVV